MALFELHGGAVSAGGTRLLEGLDISMERRDRVALKGKSGAGKTTLLRALAGLIDLDAGELTLEEASPDDIGWSIWRRRVLYVAQRPVVLKDTVEANLRRPFQYDAAAGEFERERASRWIERLGIGAERLEQDATTLSEGQRQRVCLVRALLLEPDVLLLDEPTSALDAEYTDAAEALLKEHTGGGAAMLVVTHDSRQADRLCQRVIDLQDYLLST